MLVVKDTLIIPKNFNPFILDSRCHYEVLVWGRIRSSWNSTGRQNHIMMGID